MDGDPAADEISSKAPGLAAAAAAMAKEEEVGPDSCISGIAVFGAAVAAVLRCCGCRVAGDLGDLAAVTEDERDDMDGMTSFSGRMLGVLLVEPCCWL